MTPKAKLPARPTRRKRHPPRPRDNHRLWVRTGLEVLAFLAAGLTGLVAALGHIADWCIGTGFWSHLIPFAGAVLALAIVVAALMWVWLVMRRWLLARSQLAPLVVAVVAVAVTAWLAAGPGFQQQIGNLQALLGGAARAQRVAIAHQVYAAYRRCDLTDTRMILERGQVYEAAVHEAAAAFAVDGEVLMGIGATESSFYPRDTADGGRGIFQITSPPTAAVVAARRRLESERLDPLNQRHNAFVAAATLRRYLDEMHGDVFLGLLAYNIGPRNGGLRSIMRQYGARDFVTIQPYLKNLPRDYPIRVLSAALAYRVWRTENRLLRYEQGNNAQHIQQLGIPGFEPAPLPRLAAPEQR